MLLRELQCLLGELYGIDVAADVRDFLVTDQDALRYLEKPGAREPAEKLLIEERDGELGLALYLDAALVARLEACNPRESLCGRNLEDFCHALEGVSHFNYVAWNAALDKPVTLLELEMQAEIDKYVSARALLARQPGSDVADLVFGHLFDGPEFDDSLAPAELDRYRDANRLAGRYCHSLQSRFPAGAHSSGWGAMLRELRAFYRWPQPAKVSHIRSAALSSFC